MSEVPAPVTFPELIFGLAGPIGVDLNLVESILAAQLKQVNYEIDSDQVDGGNATVRRRRCHARLNVWEKQACFQNKLKQRAPTN